MKGVAPNVPSVTPFAVGLLTGLSLIVAIGAQNAYVLRQGVRREHVGVVVAICAISDAVLIAAGTAGIGALVSAHPGILTVLTWAGAAYLVWFAIRSFISAWRPEALTQAAPRSHASVALTTLALTWLNPHVYLDTVLMLGNLANQHGPQRWVFADGAMAASLLWFVGLGYGARRLAGPLGRPSTWRVLDAAIGVIMLAIAARLLLG